MGKIKDIIEMEKQNMPDYQFKFLYHRVMPGFIFVLGGAIISLGLGIGLYFITYSEFIPFIPLIIWGIATIILLILFVIYGKKYSLMLIEDKSKEFEKVYKLVDYDKAIIKLEKNKIIVDDKLYLGKDMYFFKELNIFFFSKTLSGAYYFRFEIYNRNNKQLIGTLDLDEYLCTFFSKNLYLIRNYELLELFIIDKTRFLKYLYKYNDVHKMYKKYLKDNSIGFNQEIELRKFFDFLIFDYGFKFSKVNLGNMTDDEGKLIFYGPLVCYSFSNENICINFMYLFQRQDWYIRITKELSDDQIYIRKGQKVEEKYCYNFGLLAAVIKSDIVQNNEIFGNPI